MSNDHTKSEESKIEPGSIDNNNTEVPQNGIPKDDKGKNADGQPLPEKISRKDMIDIQIKVATLLFTVIAVVATLATYYSAQKWKEAEFTYSTFKQFSENKSVITANKFLDYSRARVFLDDTATYVEDDFVIYSLRIDTLNGDFKYPQGKIRDIIDDYLDQLSLFNRFAKTDLISYEKIKPYLAYHVSIIADKNNPRKSMEFRKALWDFINFYGYTDVKELCENLGYDVSNFNFEPQEEEEVP